MTDVPFQFYDEMSTVDWSKLYVYNWRKNKMNTEQHFCDTIDVTAMIQNTKGRSGELYKYMQSQAKVIANLRMQQTGYGLVPVLSSLINNYGFAAIMTELAKKAPR